MKADFVDECIKVLNSKLEDIGVDIESKFGDYSSVVWLVFRKDGYFVRIVRGFEPLWFQGFNSF